MSRRTTLAIVLATLLVAAGALPAAVSAQTDESTLSVSVHQGPQGSVFVTVTSNGTAVENATVVVDAENETYDGEGTYTTDADGMVAMDVPEHDVTVTFTATAENKTGSAVVELQAPSLDVGVEQNEDAEATVTVSYSITEEPVDGADVTVSTVDENDSYAGTGEYESDENGTIDLPAPDEPVEVEVRASAHNLSGSTSVTLENASTVEEEEPENFGQRVSAFVQSLLNGDSEDRRLGHMIAQWVTTNNPGNAPDHAGPPDDVGPDGDDEGEENAAADDDRERGPPDRAANDDERDDDADDDGAEADDEEDDDEDDADDDSDDDDDRGGPPEHAGSNGAGNGR